MKVLDDAEVMQGAQVTHQNALDAGKLLIQLCGDCHRYIYFPREVCPHCGGVSLGWEEPRGGGTVHAVTTVRRKPADGGDLNISIVELDEGVRLMTRVTNLPPLEVHIGARVRLRVESIAGAGLVLADAAEGTVG